MATRLLVQPKIPHQPWYDIESFYWVVLFSATKFFTPEWTVENVKSVLGMFNEIVRSNSRNPEETKGGFQKLSEIMFGNVIKEMAPGTLLRSWLEAGRQIIRLWVAERNPEVIIQLVLQQFDDVWATVLNRTELIGQPRFDRKIEQLEQRNPCHIPAATRTADRIPRYFATLGVHQPTIKIASIEPMSDIMSAPPFDRPTKRILGAPTGSRKKRGGAAERKRRNRVI